jgi:hypothetical protein
MPTAVRQTAPLSDSVIFAVARLVDDYQNPREPSHSDLSFLFDSVGLTKADPPKPAGKEKRVRHVLTWAWHYDQDQGERLLALFIGQVMASGGFRPGSPNYVGEDAIENARAAFLTEGFDLTSDGELRRKLIDTLDDPQTPVVLKSYLRRASRGSEDDALVTSTGKDLLESAAAYVLLVRRGTYDEHANFAVLLGQAFMEAGLATPQDPRRPREPAWLDVERRLFDAACAVNRLRNKEGTGHGRPFLPSVSPDHARAAVQTMAIVSQLLLRGLS